MSAAKKTVPMCCVTINYSSYIMPSDQGMKLVALMQTAFSADKDFGNLGYVYKVGDQPPVEFALVKPSQIKPRTTNASGQMLLGENPGGA